LDRGANSPPLALSHGYFPAGSDFP
jgi:hypothetical protein